VSELCSYQLQVNGETRQVHDAWLGESLLHVLRERLGLAGTKNACEQGECGSCSVLVDDVLVCACLVLSASAVGCEIFTVEALSDETDLSDVQRAFVDAGAVQCGFCTPGLIVAVEDLLKHNRTPNDLDGGISRHPPAENRHQCPPARRSAQSAWPVCLLFRPLGRRHVMGTHLEVATSQSPHQSH